MPWLPDRRREKALLQLPDYRHDSCCQYAFAGCHGGTYRWRVCADGNTYNDLNDHSGT